jgi:hypothetical protein
MPSFEGAHQISQYQGRVIEIAYLNNVQNGLGNQLRQAVTACCISRRERSRRTKKKLIVDWDKTFISLPSTSIWRFQGDVQGFAKFYRVYTGRI